MSKQLVKERVIKYLMEDLLVPHDMIDTDVPLSEFEEGAEGIIDIIVSVKDKEDYLVPVMLVSCLDEDVELEGEVVQKQIDFLEDVDNITTAGRIILTNGDQMMYADWTGEEYDTEASLPTYEQMEKELFEMEKLRNLGQALGISISKSTKKDNIIAMIVEGCIGNRLKIEGIRKGIIG